MDLEDKLITAAATTVANKILGPFVDHVFTLSKDAINEYRYKNFLTVLDLSANMCEEAGLDPHRISDRIAIPFLDAASLSDNREMQKLWAALLTNAASSDGSADSYLPGFIEFLKRMSPEQALILSYLHRGATDYAQLQKHLSHLDLRSTNAPGAVPPTYRAPLEIHLDGLLADVLINRDPNTYSLTSRGHAFLAAVIPPRPES